MHKFITGVGFAGHMHSGKDTATNYLKNSICKRMGEDYIVTTLALAQPIKQFCIDYLGMTEHQVYDQDGKAEYNDFWGMTNREILQKIGTDAMRNGFHPDVWVKIAQLKIKKAIDTGSFWIVTDVRFPNEADMIRDNGGIVVWVENFRAIPNPLTVDSKNPKTISEHISEQRLAPVKIDYILDNNNGLIELQDKIEKLKYFIIDNNYYAHYDAQYKG